MHLSKEVGKLKTRLRYTFKVKRNQRRAIYTGLGLACLLLLVGFIISVNTTIRANDIKYNRQVKLQRLNIRLSEVQKQKTSTIKELEAKRASEASLKARIEKLNKALQAKRQAQVLASARNVQVAQSIPASVYKPIAPAVVSGCGDNQYAHFIYMRESGCSLTAVNAGGCRGIGQACPGSKLPCGADYACQNTYFTNYAISIYGSWANAYNAWLSKGWW